MGKYFGTDGFRGEAGKNLTAEHAFKIGKFLGAYYNKLHADNKDGETARIVIGKDTRRSSYMFEYCRCLYASCHYHSFYCLCCAYRWL